MNKKVLKRIIGLLLTLAVFVGLGCWLGFDNTITSFYMKKILLSPFNIVGLIMVVCSFFGIWVGKSNGHKLLVTCKAISVCVSLGMVINTISSIVLN